MGLRQVTPGDGPVTAPPVTTRHHPSRGSLGVTKASLGVTTRHPRHHPSPPVTGRHRAVTGRHLRQTQKPPLSEYTPLSFLFLCDASRSGNRPFLFGSRSQAKERAAAEHGAFGQGFEADKAFLPGAWLPSWLRCKATCCVILLLMRADATCLASGSRRVKVFLFHLLLVAKKLA